MKRTLILALFASASLLPVAANAIQQDHERRHAMEDAMKSKKMLEATVNKLDREKGKITLSHGPMHNMPPMTMIYTVKDKAMLDGIKVGDTVQFRAENVKGAMELVELKPVAK